MRPVFETKTLSNQSKANLDVKILFGNIIHIIDPEITQMLEKESVWEHRLHIPFWSMIYLYIHKRYNVAMPHNVYPDLHLVG